MNFLIPQKFFRILDQPGLGEIVKQLTTTPQCPMYWRVETPRGPIYWGVQKFDPLKIQNGPMYWGVKTSQCTMYRESFSVSLNLQAQATAFKETLNHKTV